MWHSEEGQYLKIETLFASKAEDLKKNTLFTLYENKSKDDYYIMPTPRLSLITNGKTITIQASEICRRKLWYGFFELGHFMEEKRDLIEQNENITLESYKDDGDCISLHCSMEYEMGDLKEIIVNIRQDWSRRESEAFNNLAKKAMKICTRGSVGGVLNER